MAIGRCAINPNNFEMLELIDNKNNELVTNEKYTSKKIGRYLSESNELKDLIFL